jgi:hypothetical protein
VSSRCPVDCQQVSNRFPAGFQQVSSRFPACLQQVSSPLPSALSLQPPAASLQLSASSLQPLSLSLQPQPPASASSLQPPASIRKSSQASSRALRPPFWSHLETPQKHRKQPDLTLKCLNQEVVPGLFQSSQATILELWASPELLGPPGTQLDTSWSHLETPPKHRKRLDLTGKCLNQEVVIQASSTALRPPFWSSGLPLTS